MFASKIQRDINLKVADQSVAEALGTDEVSVTIRKLSARALEEARAQSTIQHAAPLRAMGAELIKGLQTGALNAALDEAAQVMAERKASPEEQRKGRYGQYDRTTVLLKGIVRWSCEDRVKLGPEAIADLAEVEATTLFEAIVDLSDPPLAILAEQGKGDGGPSINS